MKPCKYRSPGNIGFVCDNHDDLIIVGEVTEGFCRNCSYAAPEVSGDFFSQTAALLVKKHRTGELRANPQPCGGCGETKHRAPDAPAMQFVWPYWDGLAQVVRLAWAVLEASQAVIQGLD
jgi:hypothetical protein